LEKEMEDLIIITDLDAYNTIHYKIAELEDENKIAELETEKEKYYTIKDQETYKKISDQLLQEYDNEFSKLTQNELLIKKNDSDYIAIENGFH
jgi:predicted MarR family transcription regulator